MGLKILLAYLLINQILTYVLWVLYANGVINIKD